MADKLLKSIKFPTLPDRYVIGDSTLTEEGAAAEAKAVGEALATKADTKGTYEDLIVGGAEQLMADGYETDADPYLFRTTGGSADVGNREYVDKIVGGTVAWNQLVSESATSVTVQSGHKYIAKIGGAWSVAASSGSAISVTGGSDMFIDLTAMFGSTIADYIYSLEQSQAGAGVAWFRRYFPEDYYPYHAVSLESVQTSAHKTYDADGNVIGNYALDSSLTLRGVPKLADGKLTYDGDTYESDGTVTRKYGIVDLGTLDWVTGGNRAHTTGINPTIAKFPTSTDLPNAIAEKYEMIAATGSLDNNKNAIAFTNNQLYLYYDGSTLPSGYMVYELTTPTTETAEGYEHYQICDPSGTEEFVTTGIVPVGHETRYPHDLKKKVETAPDSPSTDGTYLMKRSGGKNTYMALPSTPSANGAYVLTVTVSGGTASYSWTAKE